MGRLSQTRPITSSPDGDNNRCTLTLNLQPSSKWDICSFVVFCVDKNTGRLKNLHSCGLLRCTSQEAATNIGAAFNSSAEDDEDDEDDEHDL